MKTLVAATLFLTAVLSSTICSAQEKQEYKDPPPLLTARNIEQLVLHVSELSGPEAGSPCMKRFDSDERGWLIHCAFPVGGVQGIQAIEMPERGRLANTNGWLRIIYYPRALPHVLVTLTVRPMCLPGMVLTGTINRRGNVVYFCAAAQAAR